MTATFVLRVIAILYKEVLRDILCKAVESTETPFDDVMLSVCDRMFDAADRVGNGGK